MMPATSMRSGKDRGRTAGDGPVRTCVGCLERDQQRRLRRVVAGAGGELRAGRRASGRGAYVHPSTACFALAVRRGGFARSFRRPVEAAAVEAIFEQVVSTQPGGIGESPEVRNT